jgi:hypothetical protein
MPWRHELQCWDLLHLLKCSKYPSLNPHQSRPVGIHEQSAYRYPIGCRIWGFHSGGATQQATRCHIPEDDTLHPIGCLWGMSARYTTFWELNILQIVMICVLLEM